MNERAKTAREMNGGSRGGVVPSHREPFIYLPVVDAHTRRNDSAVGPACSHRYSSSGVVCVCLYHQTCSASQTRRIGEVLEGTLKYLDLLPSLLTVFSKALWNHKVDVYTVFVTLTITANRDWSFDVWTHKHYKRSPCNLLHYITRLPKPYNNVIRAVSNYSDWFCEPD